MIPKQKKNRKQRKNTRKKMKRQGKGYIKPLLSLTQLEPTPLASKLIEHSRFLTSLFPFFLEAEIAFCPSSTKIKKSKKTFSDPLKEILIVRKHDLASCTPPSGLSPFEYSPTLKAQEGWWSLQDIPGKNWGEYPYTQENGLGGNKTHW